MHISHQYQFELPQCSKIEKNVQFYVCLGGCTFGAAPFEKLRQTLCCLVKLHFFAEFFLVKSDFTNFLHIFARFQSTVMLNKGFLNDIQDCLNICILFYFRIRCFSETRVLKKIFWSVLQCCVVVLQCCSVVVLQCRGRDTVATLEGLFMGHGTMYYAETGNSPKNSRATKQNECSHRCAFAILVTFKSQQDTPEKRINSCF